jgi:hypothetical protein
MITTLPINYNQLYEPKISNLIQDISNFDPFYTDTYMTLILNNNKIIILNDEEIIKNHCSNDILKNVVYVLHNEEYVIKTDYKIKISIYALKNYWWAIHIEKIHIWDYFQSISIINLLSKDYYCLLEFYKPFDEKYQLYKKY